MFARLMIGFFRLWQWSFSAVLPPTCRYQPSCSDYAIQAVRLHGPWRGGWLAIRRLSRCHPWGGHGYDPVPPRPGA
ncbi:membrane protein insertion efficiency factor YidD [Parapedomonas caeni]|jgi:putative membrane protein insertion efficiency factor